MKQTFVVVVNDFLRAKQIFFWFFRNEIVFQSKNMNVFVLFCEPEKITLLHNFDFVVSVAKTSKTDVLLNKSRKDLKIDDLHKKGILGQGVCVAVVDTGCFPHVDFVLGKNRIVFFKDFLNGKQVPYDDNGHGTFVTGVLGGNGLAKGGKFKGVAPASNFVCLKALDQNGETQGHNILRAMDWILDNAKKFDIKVVCMSFGSNVQGENDPLIQGAEMLWQSGIVVVCAAGNDGPEPETIKSPGASPSVITVGSADKIGDLSHIRPAHFSSRGPSQDFFKPDVVAPGVEIVSTTNTKKFYATMSGTSVSTPFVAGLCALALCQNKNLSPNEIKFLLQKSAIKTGFSPNETGSGLIDPQNFERLLGEV